MNYFCRHLKPSQLRIENSRALISQGFWTRQLMVPLQCIFHVEFYAFQLCSHLQSLPNAFQKDSPHCVLDPPKTYNMLIDTKIKNFAQVHCVTYSSGKVILPVI